MVPRRVDGSAGLANRGVSRLFWNYWREFSVYYGWKAMGEHGLDVESGFAREDILLRRAAVYRKGEVPIEYVQ